MNSCSELEGSLRKKLWAIKAMGKMKINLWRLAHNCLPSGQQLQQQWLKASMSDRSGVRVVVQDILFQASTRTSVSFMHAFCLCNYVAHILARSAEQFLSSVFRFAAPDCIRETLYYDMP